MPQGSQKVGSNFLPLGTPLPGRLPACGVAPKIPLFENQLIAESSAAWPESSNAISTLTSNSARKLKSAEGAASTHLRHEACRSTHS
jgi:hypothetical protein